MKLSLLNLQRGQFMHYSIVIAAIHLETAKFLVGVNRKENRLEL